MRSRRRSRSRTGKRSNRSRSAEYAPIHSEISSSTFISGPKYCSFRLLVHRAQRFGGRALAALRHLVGGKLELSEHGLTVQRAAELLEEVVDEVRALLLIAVVTDSRYSISSASLQVDATSATKIT